MGYFYYGSAGLTILVSVIFFIVLGIYYKVNENIARSKKRKLKENAIANFKFKEFISVINSMYPSAKKINFDENKIIFKEPITNGVEEIGNFYFSVVDTIELKTNSVGNVRVHNYFIDVGCQIKPNVRFSFESGFIDIHDEKLCREWIIQLKEKVKENQLFVDAIEVNKIK